MVWETDLFARFLWRVPDPSSISLGEKSAVPGPAPLLAEQPERPSRVPELTEDSPQPPAPSPLTFRPRRLPLPPPRPFVLIPDSAAPAATAKRTLHFRFRFAPPLSQNPYASRLLAPPLSPFLSPHPPRLPITTFFLCSAPITTPLPRPCPPRLRLALFFAPLAPPIPPPAFPFLGLAPPLPSSRPALGFSSAPPSAPVFFARGTTGIGGGGASRPCSLVRLSPLPINL